MNKLIACIVVLVATAQLACAQTSFITYQGQLLQSNQPVTASTDFTFRIYTAATGGTQVGNSFAAFGVVPRDGVFTTQIAISNANYTGADRWLEVDTRPSGVGATFTTLSPRQRLTPTPYAVRSLSERWTDTGTGVLTNDAVRTPRVFVNRTTQVTGAEYFGITTPTGQEEFGGMYINTAAGDGFPFYGYAAGGQVKSYTFHNGATNTWTLFHGGERLNVSSTGRVGINTQPTGTEALQVAGNTSVVGDVQASRFVYRSPQQHVLNFGPEDFRPANSSTPGVFGGGSFPIAKLDDTVGFGEIVAGLDLPQGATITGIHFIAEGTATPLTFTVRRREFTGSANVDIAEASSANAVSQVAIATLLPQALVPIDNFQYVYTLEVRCTNWASNTYVRFVRVFYTKATAD